MQTSVAEGRTDRDRAREMKFAPFIASRVSLLAVLCLVGCAAKPQCDASPLAAVKSEFSVQSADGRTVQHTLWQPERAGNYPLMVFSHGAFSAPQRYDAILSELAGMGFVVAAPLHIDSELLDGQPAPPEVWRTRKLDVASLVQGKANVPEQLGPGVELARSIVVAGHSYGAFGAQVAAGAVAVGEGPDAVAPEIVAVLAFSPPGTLPGFIDEESWRTLSLPQLLLTGTADILPGFIDEWQRHAGAWENAAPDHQWLWVGNGVDHYFGNIFGRLNRDVPAQQAQFEQAIITTGQFLQAYVPGGVAVCASRLEPFESQWASLKRR